MSIEEKFTSKKDFWGNETLYDEKGREIGKVEKNWFGDTVVKNSSGDTIGSFSVDSLGRRTFNEDRVSIFTGHHTKTRVDSNDGDYWEFNNDGEWDGGN